jgi:hypothetical protein
MEGKNTLPFLYPVTLSGCHCNFDKWERLEVVVIGQAGTMFWI